jgi:hypothetical protein
VVSVLLIVFWKWSLYLNRHDITEILLKVYLAHNLNNSTEYFPVALFTKIRNYSPNFFT